MSLLLSFSLICLRCLSLDDRRFCANHHHNCGVGACVETSFTSRTQECVEPSASALLLPTVTSLRHHRPAANARQPSGPEPTNDSLGLPLAGRREGNYVEKRTTIRANMLQSNRLGGLFYGVCCGCEKLFLVKLLLSNER